MLFESSTSKSVVVEKPRNGTGSMEGRYAFQMGEAPENRAFRLLATLTLQPGSSTGYHRHLDDEEVYAVLSDRGVFTDNDNRERQAGPGDITLTRKEEWHGLSDRGEEPLVFLAVVVKK
jgi:mannose-6-phosphate isomerase-like protein (cupin superfamily)